MIRGEVIHGDSIGKTQGWPTANIAVDPKRTQLKSGCYAGRALLDGQQYDAAIIIASKPYKVEVYLLDYSGPDFYGKVLSAEAVQKVSEVINAKGDELRAKIKEDIRRIKRILQDRK